jgi:hypothetical protein
MSENGQNAVAAHAATAEIPHKLTGTVIQAGPPASTGPITLDSSGEELLPRRSLTGPEVALVIAFLVVGAVLLILGQPMLHIIELLAGVGGIAVIVLARRLPRLSVR